MILSVITKSIERNRYPSRTDYLNQYRPNADLSLSGTTFGCIYKTSPYAHTIYIYENIIIQMQIAHQPSIFNHQYRALYTLCASSNKYIARFWVERERCKYYGNLVSRSHGTHRRRGSANHQKYHI